MYFKDLDKLDDLKKVDHLIYFQRERIIFNKFIFTYTNQNTCVGMYMLY